MKTRVKYEVTDQRETESERERQRVGERERGREMLSRRPE